MRAVKVGSFNKLIFAENVYEYNLRLKENNELISNTWYRFISKFDENGYAKVEFNNGIYGFINIKEEILCNDIFYKEIGNFNKEGIAQAIREDGSEVYINMLGEEQ